MGIRNALKMAMMAPEPEPEVAAASLHVQPTSARMSPRSGGAATFRTVPPLPSQLTAAAEDPEMAADIEAVLAKCQSRGYAELLTQVQVLESIDEATRFSMALATLNALMQLTPAQIKAAVQERLTALESHLTAVKGGLDAEVQETRSQNEQHLATSKQRLAEIEAEEMRLRTDIRDTEASLNEIENKHGTVLASFEVTFGRYHDELSRLLSHIG